MFSIRLILADRWYVHCMFTYVIFTIICPCPLDLFKFLIRLCVLQDACHFHLGSVIVYEKRSEFKRLLPFSLAVVVIVRSWGNGRDTSSSSIRCVRGSINHTIDSGNLLGQIVEVVKTILPRLQGNSRLTAEIENILPLRKLFIISKVSLSFPSTNQHRMISLNL